MISLVRAIEDRMYFNLEAFSFNEASLDEVRTIEDALAYLVVKPHYKSEL